MTQKKGTPEKKGGKGVREKETEGMLAQSRLASDCRYITHETVLLPSKHRRTSKSLHLKEMVASHIKSPKGMQKKA